MLAVRWRERGGGSAAHQLFRLVDPPLTLEDLAMQFHISRERVRQIEMRAFQKVQGAAHAASERMMAATEFAQVDNQSRSAPMASARLTAC